MLKYTRIYDSKAHAKTCLRYHIVFSTKYRRKCLLAIQSEVLAAFRHSEECSDYRILYMNMEDDHIHFLLKWKPSLSIEQVVRRMKQLSTIYLWKQSKSYLNQFFWGPRHRIWTNGYFCATVGNVSDVIVAKYIEKQVMHNSAARSLV